MTDPADGGGQLLGGLVAVLAATATWGWLALPRPAGPMPRGRRLLFEGAAVALWLLAFVLLWNGAMQRRATAEVSGSALPSDLAVASGMLGAVFFGMIAVRLVVSERCRSWRRANVLRGLACALLVVAFAFGGCWGSALSLLTFG